jgi:phenylacetate-CoA ligase
VTRLSNRLENLGYALHAGAMTLGGHRLPRSLVHQLALRRFRDLIRYAQTNVAYYRETLRGVDPASIDSVEAIARIPTIDKHVLREHAARLLADDASPKEQLFKRSSSGSSGTPSATYFDPHREVRRRTQELRLLFALGVRPWHRQLILDAPAHLANHKPLVQRLGLFRREPFPFDAGIDKAQAFVEEHKPDVIHGVLAPLRLLAFAVKAKAGTLSYSPRLVISKGELLDAATRKLIETTLRAPLRDYYATEEVGIVAWEDPSGGFYNVDEDFVFVECLRADGTPTSDGEVGELVLTNLYHRAMPIIRFRTGDLGVLYRNPRSIYGLPRLEGLRGRRMDCIVTPDRRILGPYVLIGVLEHIDTIAGFQITQLDETQLRIEVSLTGAEAGHSAVVGDIHRAISAKTGAGLRLDIVMNPALKVLEPRKAPIVKGVPGLVDRKLAEGYELVF